MQTSAQAPAAPAAQTAAAQTAAAPRAGGGGAAGDEASTAVRVFVYGCTVAYHVTLRLATTAYKIAIYFWPLSVWLLRKYIWWYFGRYVAKTSTALAWASWFARKIYRYVSSRGRAPPPPKPSTAPETPPPPPPEPPKFD